MRYYRAENLGQALNLINGGVTILSGGTDFYPDKVMQPIKAPVLDISGISELNQIIEQKDCLEIGSAVTWTSIIETPLDSQFDGLKLAAGEIGSVQIQNQGTIGGNICNASPAADSVPPLLTLDAEVVLRSSNNERVLPLQDFILGNRKTAINSNELLTTIRIPRNNNKSKVLSHFLKLGSRKILSISIVMVAAAIELKDEKIRKAAVAVGACSEVAKRLSSLEQRLQGQLVEKEWENLVLPEDTDELTPIDDIRADADYRRHAAGVLIKRVLEKIKSKR